MSVSLFEQVAAGKAPAVLPLTVEQFHRMIQTGIIPESQIELYELPVATEGRYDRRTDFKTGQTVRVAIDPNTLFELAVSELLP